MWRAHCKNAAASRKSYQSSTSAQRAGDAARDAQDAASLDDADWDEYWRVATEDIHGASLEASLVNIHNGSTNYS